MTRWIKARATKSDDLGFIPRIYMVGRKKELTFVNCPVTFTCVYHVCCTCVPMPKMNKYQVDVFSVLDAYVRPPRVKLTLVSIRDAVLSLLWLM